MNPAIEGLLATIEQTGTIALNKARSLDLTDEQVREMVADLKGAVQGSEGGEPDLKALLAPAQSLANLILGPHKRMLQKNTFDALDTLASLTFEEFLEFQEASEKRTLEFLFELNPIVREIFEVRIMPVLLREACGEWGGPPDEQLL